MNSRVLEVAQRIAELRAEFSESEILEAFRLLEEYGSYSSLLAALTEPNITSSAPKKKRPKRKVRPIEEQRSRAVIALEQTDPEKYRILAGFETLVRQARVLPERDDIRRLGERISKDFAPKKSRRQAISRLMALIAGQPLDEIREIVSATLSTANLDDNSNEYQELARFIIRGKNPQSTNE